MKTVYIFLLLFVGALSTLCAQVSGRVTDVAGEPIFSANVYWMGTTLGTQTEEEGGFELDLPETSNRTLIVSFIGFENDTLVVTDPTEPLLIRLRSGVEMDEVQIMAHRFATMKLRSTVMNSDMISSEELLRAACCNLGESFTTNPSVDVSYSDAATGAKQIKLLGLSGSYVQLLTENIPNYRGVAAPFSLGYIPGPWMQSIQVSKGNSSVKNGYEAITGQINVEYKKPQTTEQLAVNLFASSMKKMEANVDGNYHINKRLSTSVLAHYEDVYGSHDDNGDGFLDMPKVRQTHLQNRWAWMGDNYVFQAGIKGLKEERESGQSTHGVAHPTDHDLYTIGIHTQRVDAFTKNAYIFDKERGTNLALMLSGSVHEQEANYGYRRYDVNQKNLYSSLMFETNFTPAHTLSTGLSVNHDYFDQRYRLEQAATAPLTHDVEKETVWGGYAQYTFNPSEKWVLMGGLRADHSSMYGAFLTPRAHVKWAPREWVNLRASVGKGYRTNHVLAENNFLLASGREVIIDQELKQEAAWNYGVSSAFYLPLFGKTLNINAEYYYTHFSNQLVVDMDRDPHAIHFSNLQGKSYSHTLQVDATYPLFEGFTLTAAYRLTDVKSTYNNELKLRPLTNRYKGLLTASYQTPLELWQFDATLQLNGGGRMPTPYTLADGTASWRETYPAFEQLNLQVTRWFRNFSLYAGVENLTGYTQKNPIIGAANPWDKSFDSTMIYAPIFGAMYYAGVRFNLEKK